MAEKKSGPSYEAIMKDLKGRKFAPVYLLMGEEAYYIDRISDHIINHVMPEEERDFNQTIVYGADTTAAQLADAARGYPMMAEYRTIIVKEAQAISNWEALEKYLEKPVKSTILVICYKNGTVDRRRKLVSRCEAAGVVFVSEKKRDRDLPPFIESYVKQNGCTIEYKSTMMLAEHIGSDLNRLASELDKVMLSLPENDRRITPEIVEQKVGVSKEFNVFELKNAIISKDVYKANVIIKYFDNNPKAGSLFSMLPVLFSYFQTLMMAYYAPDRRSEQAVAQFLELRSVWQVRDYMVGMRNYSGRKTLDILSKIRETDAKSKGLGKGNTTDSDLMKELIFFILH